MRFLKEEDLKPGTKIIFEGFCDSEAGWEFDAPLHIVKPFHLYRIISSLGSEAGLYEVERIFEYIPPEGIKEDTDKHTWWPYHEQYVKRTFRLARRGKARRGIHYFKVEVKVLEGEFNHKIRDITPKELRK